MDTKNKMRVVECVLLFFVLVVSPPLSSPSTIQQQSILAPPVSAALLTNISAERYGDAPSDTKVQQVQKKQRVFPGARTPMDPLSVTPLKPKRDRERRIKPSQKRRPAAASVEQVTAIQTGSFTPARVGQSSSEQAKKNHSQQEPTLRSPTTQKTPSDHPIRTKLSKTSEFPRTGFGLPLDRISLGRLPSGRR